jgi:hypothetical protein
MTIADLAFNSMSFAQRLALVYLQPWRSMRLSLDHPYSRDVQVLCTYGLVRERLTLLERRYEMTDMGVNVRNRIIRKMAECFSEEWTPPPEPLNI